MGVPVTKTGDKNLDELTNKYYTQSQFIDYKADKEEPLPMIFQSGYLTIKAYREERQTFLLDFPNDEVRRGFVTLVSNNYLKTKSSETGTIGDWKVEE